jgi:outer membrane protein assembly factor BamA
MTRTAVTLLLLTFAILSRFAEGAGEQQLTVEDLACRGNATTSCTFILGQVYLAPGDVLDEDELANAKLRLSSLQNFSAVSIYLEKGSARGKARVIVEVVERSPLVTDFSFGLAAVNGDLLQEAAGRVTHNNLFGTGKILDLRAGEFAPIESEQPDRQSFARLSYVDPHLLDTKRYFMGAGVGYLNRRFEREVNGDQFYRRQLHVDLTFGRRLWDFSHFSMGYQYRPVRELFQSVREDDGRFETRTNLRSGVLIYSYGWNTEDDPYFPTHGSVLHAVVIASGGESESGNILWRQTWPWGRSSLSFQLTTPTERSFSVARPIAPNDLFGGVRRGRWFVGVNYANGGHTAEGRDLHVVGARIGVLFETERYGLVRLYVFRNTVFE